MKTSPSSLKIRQLIIGTRDNKIIPRPQFQRRLVWTPQDKIKFIDTVLKGFPFPEIYLSNGPVDVDTGEGSQLLVDGQQRVATINEFFAGSSQIFGGTVLPYQKLDKDEKENFLNYDVAVRDLGSISGDEIIEVFSRINATKYSLNDMEINNAVYTGRLMQVAVGIAESGFFDTHRVFRTSDIKRMGDVRFVLGVIITMMYDYFNRDDEFENALSVNDNEFERSDEIVRRIRRVFDYIDEVGFTPRSRIWKRSDLFTAMVEFDRAFEEKYIPGPAETLQRIENFFSKVDDDMVFGLREPHEIYAKAALQASNDRLNRIRRGFIFSCILKDEDPFFKMIEAGLV